MHADNFSLTDYFARIDYAGPRTPDIETVTRVMRRQLFSVPFENLDVQAGKIVSLVPEEIVDKIIQHKRGGYCYEVNGLFSMALESLGIAHRLAAARPMTYPMRRPRTHMVVIVELEAEQWLCDLGFGANVIRSPIPLTALDVEIDQEGDIYMLSLGDDGFYVLRTKIDGEWANLYAFDLSPQEWVDFMPANYLNSTHPDSIFVQKLVVVLLTDSGRKTLAGDSFKTVSHGRVEKRTIAQDEVPGLLAREFGLTMPPRL